MPTTISNKLFLDVSRESLSARVGLYARISSLVTLCHIGRITFSPCSSLLVNPRSSYSGQSFFKKAVLITTTPYLEYASPLSIERERLSPNFSSNKSYQTFTPNWLSCV